MATRRKCFISYHHADQAYVDAFVNHFDSTHNLFIARQLGSMPDDVINSYDTDYVMRRIREEYIADSTVTIVLMGKCTWARRYVDWEIQASLRSGDVVVPNGLLGIKLPQFTEFPARFNMNLITQGQADCYARWLTWDNMAEFLWQEIDNAFYRRASHKHLIVNPRERMVNNRQCQ